MITTQEVRNILLTAIDGLNPYIASEEEVRAIAKVLILSTNHTLEKGRTAQLKEYLSNDV